MSAAVFAAVEAAAALHQAGRLEEALTAYEGLLAEPGAPRATLLQLLAMLHVQAGRPDAALAVYDALADEGAHGPVLARARAEALNDRGLDHSAAGRNAEALADFEAAVALAPELAVAWSNHSVALRRLGRRADARASADRAVQLAPAFAEAWNNLGLAHADLNAFDAAQASYEEALRLRPDWAEALNNLGLALAARGELDAAQARHAQAAASDPAHGAYLYNLALLALRRGRYVEGWRGLEHRWRRPGQPGPTYPDASLWLGGPIDVGAVLLLHAEQGLGDTLQFCRYAALAKAVTGARIVLEVQPELAGLMATLDGVDEVRAIGEARADVDRHAPLMSLPLALEAFAHDDPRVQVPYLHADPARVAAWRARLGADGRRRIGLVWAGNSAHQNDHNRSIPLQALELLVRAAAQLDVELVSLQARPSAAERAQLAGWGVCECGSGLGDFSDTAAALEALDLLISVDTSVIHLAGALGRPGWLLLPAVGDWRWGDAGERTPWYPSLRLVRQPRPDAWPEAIEQTVAALTSLSWDAAPGGTAHADRRP